MDVDFEQAAGVPGVSLRVSGLYAAGPSLTNKVVHDFNGLSNIDAYDSVRLYDSGRFQDESGRFSKSGNAGFYLVAEQELRHSSGEAGRTLAVFGRVGMANEDRNLVPFYFDTGFSFRGIFSSRVADALGIGFSYTQLSDGPAAGGGNEKVVELTYRLALGEHVSVQPDLQFIIHAGAREEAAIAVVAGLRFNLSY